MDSKVYDSIDELMANVPVRVGFVRMYHPKYVAADGNPEVKVVKNEAATISAFQSNGFLIYKEPPKPLAGMTDEPKTLQSKSSKTKAAE